MLSTILELALVVPAVLFAITIHEYAHGWVADRLGDPTARLMGRLTLNPLAHLDPIGALMLVLVRIGWAKPVPVNPNNLRDPRRDMIWVSLAGPVTNLAAALVLGTAVRLMVTYNVGLGPLTAPVLTLLVLGVVIDVALAIFNFLPIPPLDGSKVLAGLLPGRWAYQYLRFERFGPIALIGLILAGQLFGINVLGRLINPAIGFFVALFTGYPLQQFKML
ncbi:MAG: site-2 protease family protein [Candidatus Edwardsbacteria bacterium]|jgi:Zn-dependent protease|nr:site-2 protease family protein [Candidatus Edwardsbacteria bacterium]